MSVRDEKGRFKKGCPPGPGRPKAKPRKATAYQTFTYKALRDAWFIFKNVIRLVGASTEKDYFCCRKCGNDDENKFLYRLDKRFDRLRFKCLVCGCWMDLDQKHDWYIPSLTELGPLSKEDVARVAIQRKAGYDR